MLKMPKIIVINTSPLIAIIAGLGDLSILRKVYKNVVVPYEVSQEILAKGQNLFGAKIFSLDSWLDKREKTIQIEPFLNNSLDKGEASVIQTAINEGIETVCIDEVAGRRIARLNNLKLTGSLGIIIAAIRKGEKIDIKNVINNMRINGVWISKKLEAKAIELVNKQYGYKVSSA